MSLVTPSHQIIRQLAEDKLLYLESYGNFIAAAVLSKDFSVDKIHHACARVSDLNLI